MSNVRTAAFGSSERAGLLLSENVLTRPLLPSHSSLSTTDLCCHLFPSSFVPGFWSCPLAPVSVSTAASLASARVSNASSRLAPSTSQRPCKTAFTGSLLHDLSLSSASSRARPRAASPKSHATRCRCHPSPLETPHPLSEWLRVVRVSRVCLPHAVVGQHDMSRRASGLSHRTARTLHFVPFCLPFIHYDSLPPSCPILCHRLV